MSVQYVARKCTQCAGRLEMIKEKKIWKCLYCGAEIERQEQYDGLFSIKNVVRQSLLDTAYRRLDSAAKNIAECEKIDSRYVGTLIAKIAFDMIRVTFPECDPREARSIFKQLKKNYDLLKANSIDVTDEEEILYEFFEDSNIFATLVLVYDTLNDITRRDYIERLLNPREVFSKPANNHLLNYAITKEKFNLADQIISNTDHIDLNMALHEVLAKYPDTETKGNHVAVLISNGAINTDERRMVENYLVETQDDENTKGRAVIAALNHGIPIKLELIMNHVVGKADPDTVKNVLTAFCKDKISDTEIGKILEFAFSCGNLELAVIALDCLTDNDQYVAVPAKLMISMLEQGHVSVNDKVALLKKTFEFMIDKKSYDSVLHNYLCYSRDSSDNRKVIIDCLLERAENLPTSTVETYVLTCSIDGINKPLIVSALFDKGLNITFYHDLLSNYMKHSADENEVKASITEVLANKGLKMDASSFIEYICNSADEVPAKLQFSKRMIVNGLKLRTDAANLYLEEVTPDQFSSEILSLIITPGCMFSARAIENYLLRIKDGEAVKAQNAKKMLEHVIGDAINAKYQVNHLGNTITCNLLQAYVLMAIDSEATAVEIVDYLMSVKKLKINEAMNVSGSNMKMRKYAVANRDKLNAVTNSIFGRHKVYSIIF